MKLRRTLLALALPVLMSAPAQADSHTVTVFQCVNKNDRQVKVTLINGQYQYQFGKLNQQPDIEITRSPKQLTQGFFQTRYADTDTGYAASQEIDFKNGTYTYTIFTTHSGSKIESGVEVYNKDKKLTKIVCVPNTVVDNIYEHLAEIPERPE
ncbi:hypothetical protein ABN222_03575 [Providencia alcalifaciens]